MQRIAPVARLAASATDRSGSGPARIASRSYATESDKLKLSLVLPHQVHWGVRQGLLMLKTALTGHLQVGRRGAGQHRRGLG